MTLRSNSGTTDEHRQTQTRADRRFGSMTVYDSRCSSAVALSLLLLLFPGLLLAQNRPPRDEAVSLAIAGDYQRAYNIFRELLHDAPDDPLLNYYTGAACVRMNKQAEGIGYLERAVSHEAPFPQAYQELADAYLKRKLTTEARDVVEKGLGRFPKNLALQKLQAKIQELKAGG